MRLGQRANNRPCCRPAPSCPAHLSPRPTGHVRNPVSPNRRRCQSILRRHRRRTNHVTRCHPKRTRQRARRPNPAHRRNRGSSPRHRPTARWSRSPRLSISWSPRDNTALPCRCRDADDPGSGAASLQRARGNHRQREPKGTLRVPSAIPGMPFGQLDPSSPAAVLHRADPAAGDQYHRRGMPGLPSFGYERPSSSSPVTRRQGRDRCDAHRYRCGQCTERRPAKRDFATWGVRRRSLEVTPTPPGRSWPGSPRLESACPGQEHG